MEECNITIDDNIDVSVTNIDKKNISSYATDNVAQCVNMLIEHKIPLPSCF